MASDKDKGTDILDDFDLDSDSLPDIEEDLLETDSSFDLPADAEEGELEQYGVWVKSEPETVEESPVELAEAPLSDIGDDLEVPGESDDEMLTQEEEDLLSELEEHDEGEEIDIPSELPEIGDEFADTQEVEVALSEGTSFDGDFGSLDDIGTAGTSAAGDGGEVLEKIEKELFEIKNELAELKRELTLLRKPGVTVAEEAEVEVQPVDSGAKGFFDEEEDETIALTGDELDNILNTADITEEVAEDTSLSGEEEPSEIEEALEVPETLDIDLGEADLEAEEVLPSIEEPSELDIELPEAEGELATPDIEDIEELGLDEEFTLELPEEESSEEISLPVEAEGPLETEEFELPVIEEELEGEEISLEPLEVETPAEETLDELVDLESEEAIPSLDEEISLELPDEEEGEPSDLEALEELGELPEEGEEITLELPEEEVELSLEAEDEALADEGLQSEEPLDLEELAVAEEPSEEADEIALELPEDDFAVDMGEAEATLEEMTELPTGEDEEHELEPVDIEDELEALEELSPDEAEGEAFDLEEATVAEEAPHRASATASFPKGLQSDIKTVLSYMDQLLESLPEDKIEEFAKSEYFEVYKKLFEELGIVK